MSADPAAPPEPPPRDDTPVPRDHLLKAIHEINNPLSVVIANLELALRRLTMDTTAVSPIALEELRDAAACAEMVRRIVDALDGSVRRGAWTRETDTPAPAPAAPAAWRRGRVLVIDDDWRVARMIARVLAEEHEVFAVDGGAKALDRIEAGERYDVILCDLSMPGMTGIELVTILEERVPEQAARFVFVTAGTSAPRARAFLESERYRRIEKPFRPADLRNLVQEAMNDDRR